MGRIVLIEDDPSISTLLEISLQEAGFTVEVFANGAHALEHLKTESIPDLIVLDLMLPGLSGVEVIASVREHLGDKELPIIVLSASAVPQGEGLGSIKGAQAFLQKPFVMNDLLHVIRENLNKERKNE